MVFKLGLQFCQQPLAKELVTYKTLPTFWFAPETGPLILRESEWDLVERFTIQGVFEGEDEREVEVDILVIIAVFQLDHIF